MNETVYLVMACDFEYTDPHCFFDDEAEAEEYAQRANTIYLQTYAEIAGDKYWRQILPDELKKQGLDPYAKEYRVVPVPRGKLK